MSKISIRPHHMLCLQFFEGKGYSEEFVKSMSAVKTYLEENNPEVEIVKCADDICKDCPNRCGTVCKKEESVLGHDKRVYDEVSDIVGTSSDWNTITNAINERIINPKKIKEVCIHCQWSDICYNK